MTKSKFIAHYFLLNKFSYLFAVICILLVNWLQVEIPRYIQLAIDLLNQSSIENHDELISYIQLVIAFSLVMICVRILSRIYSLNPGRITEAALKYDLFQHLNLLPASFHNKQTSGKLISIINNDINGIRLFYGVGFLQFFNILFALSLTPIWMWKISPSLTFYSAVPIVLSFIFFSNGFKKLKNLYQGRMLDLQKLSEQLMNYLSGIDLIKNQQMETWVEKQINEYNQQLFDCSMKITRIQTFIIPLLEYSNHIMKVIILGLGGYYLLEQQLTIGEITAFLSYSVLLALPLMHMGRILTVFQMGWVSIDSVQRILNSPVPEQDLLKLEELEKKQLKKSVLHVKNLSFSYHDNEDTETNSASNQPILKNINFTINPGQKVGILGSIGSGKSTLVNCLNHYLDVPANCIFLGEKDITQVSRQDWRENIRTITQEPHLFSDTITENVKFGYKNSDQTSNSSSTNSQNSNDIDTEIDHVLTLSQLNDDISQFAQHKQTLVGEKGIMLSGGQKQRLSIARALLTPCDLIIMDNVLSAVDYETERKILDGIFTRVTDQSLLIVSHRVSALENMDEILVLEKGEIIARGTHKALLKSSSYYRETWQLQQHDTEHQA